MKYMVMECHPAYAVLMDEASRVVHAANLHYEVGQIVESPVLLEQAVRPVISRSFRRFVAAAACFALMAGAGALYYRMNYTVYSSIVVSAAADVRMEISRSGKVLSVQPLNQDAANLLADYECGGKDQLTVTNELIERAAEKGYVRKGDTVHVYYDQEKNKDSDDYRSNVEQAIASHDLTADVHDNCEVTPLSPPQPETPAHTETVPETKAVPEMTQPRGNAVIEPHPATDPHPDVIERPDNRQEHPAVPADPKATPGGEPTAPKISDPAKEPKLPETPADNKPAGPVTPETAPKPADPAAPAEQKPVTPDTPAPTPKEEKPVKDPAPAEPQKPDPAAPGANEKTPEKPDPGRNENLPHENAHDPLPHEEHAQPHDAGIAIGPQAVGPVAAASPEPPAPEPVPEPDAP